MSGERRFAKPHQSSMVNRMSQHPEESGRQVEFTVIVDAERAAALAPAIAELALEFDAVVVSDHTAEEPMETEEVESAPLYFRTDMATEFAEVNTNKKVWVITRDNLRDFAWAHKFDGTISSRIFNIICGELSNRRSLNNLEKENHLVRGTPVESAPSPGFLYGLRVSTLPRLESELARASDRISGYGGRSKDLLKEFITELFTPEQEQ